MDQGSIGTVRRLAVWLAAVLLVTTLIFLSYPGASTGPTSGSLHDHPSDSGSDATASNLRGVLVNPGDGPGGSLVHIEADVAVDDDFVGRMGSDWLDEVDETVDGANRLLEKVGVRIDVASVQRWRSDETEVSSSALLASAVAQVQGVPGRLLLAITSQDTVKYDGWADVPGGRVLSHFYHQGKRRNHALIAHEVGHVLGARHHENEDECTEDGCIMDEAGYAHADTWCEHHERAIRQHIATILQT